LVGGEAVEGDGEVAAFDVLGAVVHEEAVGFGSDVKEEGALVEGVAAEIPIAG